MTRPIVAILAAAGILAVAADLSAAALRSHRAAVARREAAVLQAAADAAYLDAFNACARRCEQEQGAWDVNGQAQCIEQECGGADDGR